MATKITDKDKGYKALKRRVRKARDKQTVAVGILSSAAGEVVEVATIHEFGLGDVPERSFIRGWADAERAENQRVVKAAAESVVRGTEPDVALGRVGLKFVGDIRKRIIGGIDPPLSPITIARKGSSTPLIDTGQLIGSIAHEVE